MTPNNKDIIKDVIIQELQDQLIIERVKKSNLKALLRDILKYDQGRAYINQLPKELIERIIKCLKEF